MISMRGTSDMAAEVTRPTSARGTREGPLFHSDRGSSARTSDLMCRVRSSPAQVQHLWQCSGLSVGVTLLRAASVRVARFMLVVRCDAFSTDARVSARPYSAWRRVTYPGGEESRVRTWRRIIPHKPRVARRAGWHAAPRRTSQPHKPRNASPTLYTSASGRNLPR